MGPTADNAAGSIPSDLLADLEEVCRQSAAGVVRDPDLLRRVYGRSAAARDEARRRFGAQDVGVQIIREMRDAE
jgi:hypothetical protein